jgi:hypothetical protein
LGDSEAFFTPYIFKKIKKGHYFIVLFGQVSKEVGNGFNGIESGVFGDNLTFCQIGLYLYLRSQPL